MSDSGWRTINGAHVKIEKGKIVGGAGGKFNGQNASSVGDTLRNALTDKINKGDISKEQAKHLDPHSADHYDKQKSNKAADASWKRVMSKSAGADKGNTKPSSNSSASKPAEPKSRPPLVANRADKWKTSFDKKR